MARKTPEVEPVLVEGAWQSLDNLGRIHTEWGHAVFLQSRRVRRVVAHAPPHHCSFRCFMKVEARIATRNSFTIGERRTHSVEHHSVLFHGSELSQVAIDQIQSSLRDTNLLA